MVASGRNSADGHHGDGDAGVVVVNGDDDG